MPKPNEPESPLHEQVKAEVEKATASWLKSRFTDPDSLTKHVHATLDKERDVIIAKLLGFEHDKWSSRKPIDWEVDHCNGRAGESSAGQFLNEKGKEAVKAWLESLIPNLPPPSKQLEEAALKEYNETFRRHIMEAVRARAHENASSYIKALALTNLGQFLKNE
jgi:hypothetical protein